MKSFHATKHHDVVLSLLRDRREALGIRQADLAHKLGQTQAMVSPVETGERRLDIIDVARLVERTRGRFRTPS